MREVLILLAVIAVIVAVWYIWKENSRSRGLGDPASRRQDSLANRVSESRSAPTGTPTRTAEPGIGERGAGLFQEAADSAAGLRYERAADELKGMTSDLAKARQDAERAAERLAGRANQALASIQAAAAAHGGAVPGDGTHNCPAGYPIKGNMPTLRYHSPDQLSYNRTIPEVCFQSAEAAEAAGFTESGDEPGTRGSQL
jgi:hypothetical protein